MEEGTCKPQLSRTGTKILEAESSPKMTRTSSAIASKYPSRLLKSSSVFTSETSNDKKEVVSNDDFDPFLTKDILFFIFTMLSRKDFIAARGVCKRWKSIANDPYFGWSIIKTWSGSTGRPLSTSKNYKVVRSLWNLELHDDSKDKTSFKLLHSYKAPRLNDVVPFEEEGPNLWRISVEITSEDKHDIKIIAEVRVKELERLATAGDKIAGASVIGDLILEEDKQVASKKIESIPEDHKKPHTPAVSEIAQPQPGGLTVSLKKYQLDAVAWMKSVEVRIHEQYPFKCSAVVPWRSGRCDVVLDVNSRKFLAFQHIKEHYHPVYARGGVLGDEMGLGKTMELIALILANPSPPLAELPDRVVAKDDTGPRIPEISTFTDSRFKSRATLVLCPNHLAAQWQSEIEKHTKPALKVLLLTTITQLNKYSYKDIMEADVVIASFQLLKNPRYFRIGHNETAAPRVGEESDRHGWVKSSLEEIRKKSKPESQAGPALLEHFYWYRLIIDEAHEVMDSFHMTTLNLCDYKYFWYVSGTPFPSKDICDKVLELLNFPDSNCTSSKWLHLDILFNNLYWRNTKESVQNEYEIPAWVEELIVLDFTDTEGALYKDYNGLGGLVLLSEDLTEAAADSARQLCSQIPKMDRANTIDQIRLTVIENKKEVITKERANYDKFRKELASLRKKSLVKLTVLQRESHYEDIKNVARRITALAFTLKQNASTLKLLIQSNTFESRFAKICEALNWKVPKGYSKSVTEREQQEKDLLKSCAQELDTTGIEVEIINKEENNNSERKDEDQVSLLDLAPSKLSIGFIKSMSIAEMRDELRKRNVIPSKTAKRGELKRALLDWMEKELKANPSKAELKRRLKQQKQEKEGSEEEEEEAKSKKSKSKKKRARANDDEEEQPRKIQKYDFKKKKSELELLEELLNLVEEYGTKMGNFVYYLRRLWEQTPDARVILFSQFDTVLKEVGEILTSNDIKSAFVQGNVMKKNKAIKSFRSKDAVQVIMLSIEKAASGTNLIEASHVVLLDPVSGSAEKAKAIESQAIGRAYRQGQSKQITVVRFVIRDTEEHKKYVQNYLQSDESLFAARQKDLGALHTAISKVNNPTTAEEMQKKKARHSLTKSSSISNILVSSKLKAAGDVATLLEQSQDLEVPPLSEVDQEASDNNNNNNQNPDQMVVDQ